MKRLRIAPLVLQVAASVLLWRCDETAAFVPRFSSASSAAFSLLSSSTAAASVAEDVSPFDCPAWQAWDGAYVQEQLAAVPDVQVVDSMPELLPAPDQLKNNYFLLRHGQSTANLAEIISSDRASLAYTTRHGLTSLGYQQGKAAASSLLRYLANSPYRKTIFVSSPFARARQTAQACIDGLLEQQEQERVKQQGIELNTNVVLHNLLVERSFGRLDGERIYTYAYVWPLDKFNVTHTAFGVESVAAVCTRLRTLIVDELEHTYSNCNLVLTSHADVLQIAQLYAAKPSAVGYFSSYRFASECCCFARTVYMLD